MVFLDCRKQISHFTEELRRKQTDGVTERRSAFEDKGKRPHAPWIPKQQEHEASSQAKKVTMAKLWTTNTRTCTYLPT